MVFKFNPIARVIIAAVVCLPLVLLSACGEEEKKVEVINHLAQAKAQSVTIDDVSGQIGQTFDNYGYFKETEWYLKKYESGKMEVVAKGVTDLAKYHKLEMNKKEVTERMLKQMIKKMPGIEIVTKAVFPYNPKETKVSKPTVTVDVVMPSPSQISTSTFADDDNTTFKSILEDTHSSLVLGIIIGS